MRLPPSSRGVIHPIVSIAAIILAASLLAAIEPAVLHPFEPSPAISRERAG